MCLRMSYHLICRAGYTALGWQSSSSGQFSAGHIGCAEWNTVGYQCTTMTDTNRRRLCCSLSYWDFLSRFYGLGNVENKALILLQNVWMRRLKSWWISMYQLLTNHMFNLRSERCKLESFVCATRNYGVTSKIEEGLYSIRKLLGVTEKKKSLLSKTII
jgi:hypothetical protein